MSNEEEYQKVNSCQNHGDSSIVYSGNICPLCAAQEQIKYDSELIQSMHERSGQTIETIEKLNKTIAKLMEEINQLKKEKQDG